MWATVEQAREVWTDAPLDDDVVERLLAVAFVQVEAYAPPLAVDAVVPAHYTHANIVAARDLWRHVQPLGADPYTVEPVELTAEVRAMLRPRRAIGRLR